MRRRFLLSLSLFVLCTSACSSSDGPSKVDGAVGQPDLGDASTDGGNAGDAAVEVSLRVLPACTDSAINVYVTPTGLPPISSTSQGDIVRCYRDTDRDADGPAVDKILAGKGIAIGPGSSGVQVYRVAFRTTRADGRPAASTARVYVPTSPRALPLPVVVVGHPTEGLGDSCAPSNNPNALLDVALPWAAKGYVAIAPDYTGLGNEGVQAYLDNRDQGYTLLDGARAARKMFPAGAFTNQVVISGWSQGGGAALSAQALAGSYGAGGQLAAVVAFAPEWPIRYNSFALADMARNPDTFVSYDLANTNLSYSNHVIWTQRAYGYFANYSQLTTNGGAAFPSAVAGSFLSSMDSLCGEVAIGAAIYVQAHPPFGAKNGDLFDPTFRTAFVACLDDPAQAGCNGLGKEFYDYLGKNHLKADPAGAPVLYVQGLADTVLPPLKEAACIVPKMQADGLSPTVCVDALGQHTNVTNRNIGFAISWVEAVLAGTSRPSCPDENAALPPGDCD